MFDFMKVLRLQAVFAAQEEGMLPVYLGSTVRGILGHCFREFVCDRPVLKCFRCEKRFECTYVQNFSNTGGEAGAVNPFSLHVFTQGKTEWKKGDECIFELTLYGRAAGQAGIYLDALQDMEKKGWGAGRMAFKLMRVVEADTGKLVFAGGKMWLRNLIPHRMKIEERKAGTVCVAFDTPVRIISGKALFESLPLEMLLRFLEGRLHLLAKAYGEEVPEQSEVELAESARDIKILQEEWKDVEFTRYSINQKGNKLELPAKIGWVIYEGDLSRFLPLLEAGQYLHVGKNATIGFGHYQVYYDR